MTKMKPLNFPVLLLLAALLSVSCNNAGEKNEAGDKKVTAVSDEIRVHACTEACKAGQHQFAHNEVGHTCSSDCGRPHQCGEKCSGDTHVYAHGEVSHYCMCVPGS
jgi:hypothetical protein